MLLRPYSLKRSLLTIFKRLRNNDMSELLDYLNYYDSSKLFEPGEFTTPTRFTYTAIASAVHDGADILLIKLNRFEWYSDGKFIDSYLGEDMTVPEPSY